MSEGGQKVQTSSYKSPGDVMYSLVTVVNNTVYCRVLKRALIWSDFHFQRTPLIVMWKIDFREGEEQQSYQLEEQQSYQLEGNSHTS